jgi:uncharacterized protein YsxB (DUF464 family)
MNKLKLSAEGHTGDGPHGQNIVCAGVSVLTQTLLNALTEEEEKQNITLEWDLAPGEIHISVLHARNWHCRNTAKAYFRMAVIGLEAIAQNYAGQIEIEEVQDSGNV